MPAKQKHHSYKKNAKSIDSASPLPPKNGRTFGQRASDGLTMFMGSWIFIMLFGAMLVIWMTLNVVAWVGGWDPYPFILLNLVLSTLAATQAPIIMMSQNRQEERDRLQAQYDYAVNRKAEREIQTMQKEIASLRRLTEKMHDEFKYVMPKNH